MSDEKNSLRTWLFNPYHYIAGWQALALGLIIIFSSGFIASLGNSHFDGLLDFHIGNAFPLKVFLLEGVVNWLVFAILMLLGGMIISTSKIRVLDVFGTQSLARFPYLISATTLWTLRTPFVRFAGYLGAKSQVTPTPFSLLDAVAFWAVYIVVSLMLIWMVQLMYRAFIVSCNAKGGKAKVAFITAIVLGEIITKVIILKLVY